MRSFELYLEATILLFVFFGIYSFTKSRITHRNKRLILLTMPLLAIIVPISKGLFTSGGLVNIPVIEMDPVLIESTSSVESFTEVQISWFTVYVVGVALMIFLLLFKITRLILLFRGASKHVERKDVRVLVTSKKESFSFFNRIHLSANLDEEEKNVVLEHEILHYEHLHSLDLVFMEIFHALFWFNPLLILVKRELINVHEYEVDHVLYKKYDAKYLRHLLSYALGASVTHLLLTSQFHKKTTLAKRIEKMKNNKKASKLIPWFIPLVAIIFTLTSWTYSRVVVPVASNYSTTPDQTDDAYKEPQFKGGDEAMIAFIQEHIKYPEESKLKQIEGIVYVGFIVRSSGEIDNVKVRRGVDPMLDAEAQRVVELMPNWIPGEKDGKPADVDYTLPIKFQL
ncbi:MAG: TonB family protein [Crocinitomicaceae bacterium]|nr:TonB family protein [Crocinitomicaceae bacterium]